MDTFVTFTLMGLVLGSVYAIAASGLVLTYNTSGIFNFAHGAQAMLGAFLFWQLRYGWELPLVVSLVVVLGIVGPGMGWLLYTVIMRGLRDTAEVTKIVVTVAVLLGMLSASHWFWNPEKARSMQMFFGDSHLSVFGATLRYHELLCILAAVAIAIGLRVLFVRTRAGVAMRAVVDDPDLLRLNGHRPDRLAALSWMLGSTLAVLAGILITPISGGTLEANMLTLLVIDAFAAAMFGRLRSIPRTFVGAVILGLAGTYVLAYFPTTWTWASNLRVSLPMIALFVVLIVLPQDRLRGTLVRTRERYHVPSVRKAVVWGVVLVVAVYLIRLLMVDSAVTTFTIGMCFAIIALSLTLLTGYAGEMNLAPVSFAAIATMVAFHVGIDGSGLAARIGVGGVVVAVVVTALVGGLVALPALRLRGLYLALATMAFGVFLSNMVLRDTTERELFGVRFSLFTQGSLSLPALRIGPLDLADPTAFLMTVTVLFAILGVVLIAVRNSGYGRRLAAMKDSPAASAMLGQNLVTLKLGVFMASAAIAGLGGVFMSIAMGAVSLESFSITVSLSLLMLTVVAGIGYVSGALFGGIMAGVGFAVIMASFANLARAQPELEGLWTTLGHIAAVSPALIGIGVGKNPSGIVHDVIEGYRRVRSQRRVLVAGGAVVAFAYALALGGLLDNWWFATIAIVTVFALPVVGEMVASSAATVRVPPEQIGLSVPYSEQVRGQLDRELGIPERRENEELVKHGG
ncbi:ABC transporter permease [Rhodococcus triatomae]|uniref:Branched-chain amino acid ABC-type transport system, permease component n=1 Tax=Rhodococcus triatomae TaxID=300028 RepID=A0A1G8J9Q1_9NOCA|nr:ABC transporter permease [Rhodococcus triatomae]QNG19776.1 ABC transporter permease [Rhodococcus triatomae]QNG24308.1 ABC transporter permease [Rhodococcus triatomae]SDI27812.1 Branched-chain amino acid ABC-type transport system, permease component [Rhodococcus triatomae]